MKKYQFIFTLAIWLFFLLWFYFETLPFKNSTKVYLEDLNRSVTNFQEQLFVPKEKIYTNDFKLWDMKISKILKGREAKAILEKEKSLLDKKIENRPKSQNINVKYRTICIEEKCWQLMGIVTINGVKRLTLLSKEKSAKLQIFKVGEELLPKILIKDIQGEKMILLNQEKNKKIILKLFDVEISKYIPKVIKEKDE